MVKYEVIAVSRAGSSYTLLEALNTTTSQPFLITVIIHKTSR